MAKQLGHERVQFDQGDLHASATDCPRPPCTEPWPTYMLANARPCAGAKGEQTSVHGPDCFVANHPSFGPEVMSIITKHSLHIMHNSRVQPDTIALGNEMSGQLDSLLRCISRHAQSHTGVHAHGFLDGRANIRQLGHRLCVRDRRAQRPRSLCCVHLRAHFSSAAGFRMR